MPSGENLMEGLDCDFLQQELVYRPVGTVSFSGGGLQATDTAPDDGLAAVVVPVNAPVKFTAVSAENHLCKAVIAGEAAFLTCRADVDYPATDKLRLHLHEELFRNDCLVVALDVVLRNGAVVLDALLCQEVCGVGLLQECVTHVLLVAENLVDGAGVPFCLASAGEDTVSHKPVGDLIHTKGKNRCVSRQKHALINSRERPRKSDINLEQSSHVETVALLSKLDVDRHINIEIELDELDLTSAESKATYAQYKD